MVRYSYEEINDKIKEKLGGVLKCHVCGIEGKFISSGYIEMPNLEWDGSYGLNAIPAIPYICLNCGYIHSFAIGIYVDIKLAAEKEKIRQEEIRKQVRKEIDVDKNHKVKEEEPAKRNMFSLFEKAKNLLERK